MLNYIRANFRYENGFLYRISVRGGEKIGNKAGWLTYCNGRPYWKLNINKKTKYLHHAIFLLHHGFLPKYIDHIDGDSTNNKIENLRAATQSQNMANSLLSKANTSGYKGVTYCKVSQKWKAQLGYQMKCINLGSFDNKEDAFQAYQLASKAQFQNFSRPEKLG